MYYRSTCILGLCLLPTSPAVGADEPKTTELNQIRLYVPIPQLEDRFGKNIKPLANYVKSLEKKASEILAKEKKLEAKGILIAVGIKSKKKNRVWCQAVEGEMSVDLVKLLEKELSKLEGVDLVKGPAGFAMEINLFGKKPTKFPEFPDVWIDAAKKDKTIVVPPDDLFKRIWPD